MEPIMAFPKYLGKWTAIAKMKSLLVRWFALPFIKGEVVVRSCYFAHFGWSSSYYLCKIAQLPSEGFCKIGRVTILKIPWSLTLAWTYSTLRESKPHLLKKKTSKAPFISWWFPDAAFDYRSVNQGSNDKPRFHHQKIQSLQFTALNSYKVINDMIYNSRNRGYISLKWGHKPTVKGYTVNTCESLHVPFRGLPVPSSATSSAAAEARQTWCCWSVRAASPGTLQIPKYTSWLVAWLPGTTNKCRIHL